MKKTESDNYLINFGIYWPDDEDISLGTDVVLTLLREEKIKGSTYVNVMSSEYGIKSYELCNTFYEDLICEVIPFDKTYFENIKRLYISDIDTMNKYDNMVFVIEDDPRYSNSKKDYITTTIVFSSLANSFIINIGYQMDRKWYISSEQVIKKLTLF